jgi:dTMP kinase
MSVVALVRRPGYRDLLIGQGVSSLGDWMGTVALMALVLELTNSPIAVGGILTLRLLPAAIGGPLAARAALRWDRRRTMLAMDATRAVMIALVPLVRALWWVYLLGFLVEVASIVFLPARDASIPDLVASDDELPLANGLILGTSYGSIPIGAALFAAVAALPFEIGQRPYALVFFIDALTFLVSFFCIARLTQLGAPHAVADEESEAGFLDAFRIPLVRAVMPAALSVALGLGALFSLGIVFVHDVLHASDSGFGVLIALFGVGAAAGLFALQRMPHGDLLVRTRYGVAYIGAVIAVFSLASALWIAWFGAAAFGAGAAFALSAGMGAIQSRLDGRQRVLAFAAFHVVLRVGLGVSAIAAGAAGDLLADVRWPLVGTLEPSRVVLLGAGVLVVLSSLLVRLPDTVSVPPMVEDQTGEDEQ